MRKVFKEFDEHPKTIVNTALARRSSSYPPQENELCVRKRILQRREKLNGNFQAFLMSMFIYLLKDKCMALLAKLRSFKKQSPPDLTNRGTDISLSMGTRILSTTSERESDDRISRILKALVLGVLSIVTRSSNPSHVYTGNPIS
ncbi:hypothetical protein Tco_1440579 [Tanacetum coccineum]